MALIFEGMVVYGTSIFAFIFEGVIYGTGGVWSTPLPADDLAHRRIGAGHQSVVQSLFGTINVQYSLVQSLKH